MNQEETQELANKPQETQQTSGSKWKLILILAALVIIGGAGYAIYHFSNNTSAEIPNELSLAIDEYEAQAAENPENVEIHTHLAKLYLWAGEYDKSMYKKGLNECEIALELDENHEYALTWYGLIYMGQEKYDKALEPFLRVIELNADNAWPMLNDNLKKAYYYSAEAYLKLGQIEEAFAHAEERMNLGSDAPEADVIALTGRIYQENKEYDQAINYYLNALRFDLNYPEVYEELQDCYATIGQWGHVTYTEGMLIYCNAQEEKNYAKASEEYNKAIDVLEDAVSEIPDFAKAWEGLGVSYHMNEQLNEAINAYQQAVHLDAELCPLAEMMLNTLV